MGELVAELKEKKFLSKKCRFLPVVAAAMMAMGLGGCLWNSDTFDDFTNNGVVTPCPGVSHILLDIKIDDKNVGCFPEGIELCLGIACSANVIDCGNCNDQNGECSACRECDKYRRVTFKHDICPGNYPACNEVAKGVSVCQSLSCTGNQVECQGACVDLDRTNMSSCGICKEGFANCDGSITTGCEVNLVASNRTACEVCVDDFANCDGRWDNGCEVNLNTDSLNCSECGKKCEGGFSCQGGECLPSCAFGLVYCVDPEGKGECTNPNNSLAFCGASGDCQGENAGVTCPDGNVCASGVCAGSCLEGQVYCGLCINSSTDVKNCGATGTTTSCTDPGVDCDFEDTSRTCIGGLCRCQQGWVFNTDQNRCLDPSSTDTCGATASSGGSVCPPGERCNGSTCAASCLGSQVFCGNRCVTSLTDNENCGATGTVDTCTNSGENCNPATTGRNCSNGSCVCPTGLVFCGGQCIDPKANTTYCGASGTCSGANAGRNCSSLAGWSAGFCNNGTCHATSCTAGNCHTSSNVCEAGNQNTRCGSGGACVSCTGGKTCQSNECKCPSGQIDCSGTCKNLTNDRENCGYCGFTCAAGQPCSSSQCACGTATCGGSSVNTCTTNAHCGVCNNACTGGKTCQSGACGCPSGQTDCSGTCRNLTNDNNNCGGCGLVCTGGKTCSGGRCVCPSGQEDCGGTCRNLTNDSGNCGFCGFTCAAGQQCTGSQCVCTTSGAGCTGGVNNTCTSAAHCGRCNNACASGQTCTGGVCGCPAGQTLCGTVCQNTSNNVNHCGGCNIKCATGESCTDGKCGCPAGQTLCGGECKTTANDNNNCGFCGFTCAAGQQCSGGQCGCRSSGAGCTSPTAADTCTSTSHCGKCGNVCSGGQSCINGVCGGCSPGQTLCGTTCRNLNTDTSNCGYCGFTCGSNQTCTNGNCVCTVTGQTLCGTTCRNLNTDTSNCGYCGFTCGSNQTCTNGNCVCTDTAQTLCGTTCRNLNSDTSNCGACGFSCNTATTEKTCQNRVCACIDGKKDCDGICKPLNTNTDCGFCGLACNTSTTGKSCSGSGSSFACTCAGGETDCSGICKNLNTDTANCGYCNRACVSGEICIGGNCVEPECTVNADCVGNPKGVRCNAGTCAGCNNDNQCGSGTSSTQRCVSGLCQCCTRSGGDCSGSSSGTPRWDVSSNRDDCTAGQRCSLSTAGSGNICTPP